MSSSRPRRSAAQRASTAITNMADADERPMSSRARRSNDAKGIASVSRGPPSSSAASSPVDADRHIHLNIKMPSSKLRQATTQSSISEKRGPTSRSSAATSSGRDAVVAGKRATRGAKKSYVVMSESDEEDEEEEEEEADEVDEDEDDDDDDEEEGEEEEVDEDDEEEGEEEEDEGEDEIEVGDVTAAADDDEEEAEAEAEAEDEEMEDLGDEDAEGEVDDEMDVDAEGDEDAEGDVDMDVAPPPALPPPTIKISKPSAVKGTSSASKGKKTPASKSTGRATGTTAKGNARDGDEDDELSELDSEAEEINETVEVAGGDEDAEGEEEDLDAEGEIEVADEDAEGEEEGLGTDDEGGSRAETPDLSRLTARQRAKLGDVAQEYMKLSDEVQVKKHFTAEELSMRRAEMARRRRNLSEKRNEEVKMETINKLLKKQAPKTNRRTALADGETPDTEQNRANPVFVRWISTKEGSRVAVPVEMLAGPVGQVFRGMVGGGKMVEEVS